MNVAIFAVVLAVDESKLVVTNVEIHWKLWRVDHEEIPCVLPMAPGTKELIMQIKGPRISQTALPSRIIIVASSFGSLVKRLTRYNFTNFF